MKVKTLLTNYIFIILYANKLQRLGIIVLATMMTKKVQPL